MCVSVCVCVCVCITRDEFRHCGISSSSSFGGSSFDSWKEKKCVNRGVIFAIEKFGIPSRLLFILFSIFIFSSTCNFFFALLFARN